MSKLQISLEIIGGFCLGLSFIDYWKGIGTDGQQNFGFAISLVLILLGVLL